MTSKNTPPASSPPPLPSIDLAVFTAHPDDAELCCGGLLILSAEQGWRTAVVDLTRGELGTLGSPELRAQEAEAASRILGLSLRRNLGLPDGRLFDTDENRRHIVRTVRELRPRLVIAPPGEDHHPDHLATSELVRRSFHLCGIGKYLPELEPWRPRGLLTYAGSRPFIPQLVVDISAVIERRMQAVRCYSSQFHQPGNPQPADSSPVRIAAPYFLDTLEGRLAYFGSLIGVPYGEAYSGELPLPVTDLVRLFEKEPWVNR